MYEGVFCESAAAGTSGSCALPSRLRRPPAIVWMCMQCMWFVSQLQQAPLLVAHFGPGRIIDLVGWAVSVPAALLKFRRLKSKAYTAHTAHTPAPAACWRCAQRARSGSGPQTAAPARQAPDRSTGQLPASCGGRGAATRSSACRRPLLSETAGTPQPVHLLSVLRMYVCIHVGEDATSA